MEKVSVFDPVVFSIAENEFLLANLGKPPVVALRGMPPNVNPRAVRPVLEKVYELIELETHAGAEWTGLEAIRAKITLYLTKAAQWDRDKRKGAPRFPSLYSYDQKNRPHRYGPGSDAGKVKSFIGPDGKRVDFAVDLVPDNALDWTPEWVASTDETNTSGLIVNNEANRIECTICGHTEGYKPESRGSFNAARARMSKHLRSETREAEAHRELHTLEFGG